MYGVWNFVELCVCKCVYVHTKYLYGVCVGGMSASVSERLPKTKDASGLLILVGLTAFVLGRL